MAKKLRNYVHIQDERGDVHSFGPDDKVPAWASKLMGDHVWEGSEDPGDREEPPAEDDTEPGVEAVTDEPVPASEKSEPVRRRGTAH